MRGIEYCCFDVILHNQYYIGTVEPILKEQLGDALEAANDASGKVRNQHLTFILFMVYFSLILAATTDKQLLLLSPVNLPLINIKLPLREFYVVAPWILVLLHFHLLIQFYLLSQKLHKLKLKLSFLTSTQQIKEWCIRLSAFSLNHHIIHRQHDKGMRIVLAIIVIFTMIVLPIGLLLWAQARFIPYQSETITWSHRAVVLMDIVILWMIWPRVYNLKDPLSHFFHKTEIKFRIIRRHHPLEFASVFSQWKRGVRKIKYFNWILSSIFTIFVIILSYFIIVIPNGWMENYVAQSIPESWLHTDKKRSISGKNDILFDKFTVNEKLSNNRYFFLTHWYFDLPGQPFRQNLIIRDEILVHGAESFEIKNMLRSKDQYVFKEALKKVAGLQLQGRNLRYADFKRSILVKVNFGFKDKLSNPNLKAADLRGANISFAKLQGADFLRAKLEGADISFSKLNGANFELAQLKRATFASSYLRETNFDSANLQGAVLRSAKLQGAKLRLAKLQGTNLIGAQLQGASLNGANLVGANLNFAILHGALVGNAELSGANLYNAQLQGSSLVDSNFLGTDLNNADLRGAFIRNINMEDAIIVRTRFGTLRKRSIDKLIEKQEIYEKEPWFSRFSTRLIDREGKKETDTRFNDAIHCNNIADCKLDSILTHLISVSCKNFNSAIGISKNLIRYYTAYGKTYYQKLVQGLESSECALTTNQIAKIKHRTERGLPSEYVTIL